MRGVRRERRLQRVGAGGGPDVARRGADPRDLPLPAADPRPLFAGLHVGDAAQARSHRRPDRAAVSPAFRSAARRLDGRTRTRSRRRWSPRSKRRCRRWKVWTRTASCADFVNAVQSALRTNFFQLDRDGQPKAIIAVKFDSRRLDSLPLPRPLYEIFVYSPRVEGVHLRFGKVARGGIRWSDRPQDFRTEVLGLAKTQQIKNAVIVPVGAKGGFVPKLLPKGGPRDAIQAEGVAAYKLFVSTLLDITDNLGAGGRDPAAPTWCGMTATIPIWSSPPTRAPPRSPTSPMRFRSSANSGWATPSRRAAPPATTTRKWASPRAAPGRRSSGISARWTSTSAKRRSPSPASATCRATCSATACCASARSNSSPPSIIATSSSIPIPIRRKALPSAAACSSCRVRAGRITTKR